MKRKILLFLTMTAISGCVSYKGQIIFNYKDVGGIDRELSGNLKVRGRDLGKLKTLLETLKLTIKD